MGLKGAWSRRARQRCLLLAMFCSILYGTTLILFVEFGTPFRPDHAPRPRHVAMSAATRPSKTKERDSPLKLSLLPRNCKYEGNCPALSFCGTSGWCTPYLTQNNLNDAMHIGGVTESRPRSKCMEQCIQDAMWDERYFFITAADPLHWMEHTPGDGEGPDGCIVIYGRIPSNEEQPSTEMWRSNRAGVLIRRDPVPLPAAVNGVFQRWAALCYSHCETDADCSSTNSGWDHDGANIVGLLPGSFRCTEKGQCQRRNKVSMSSYDVGREANNETGIASDLVVLSYSNREYFDGLKELAASLR